MSPSEWTLLLIVALTGLVLPISGLWPLVFSSSETRNNFFYITMSESPGQPYAAVLAQEVCEYWLRIAGALPLTALVLICVDVPWMFLPVIAAACGMWTIIPAAMRLCEYIGHAAEVLEANRILGRDESDETYLMDEAGRMHRAYGGAFAHLTIPELAAKLRAQFGVARMLIALLHRRWR